MSEARNVSMVAPVGSIDLAFEGWEITACPDCRPWRVEFVRDIDDAYVAREWHAVDCPLFRDLLRDRATAEDRIG